MKKMKTAENVNKDSSTKKGAGMPPRRAALILIYDWITMGSASPWYMDAEEMSDKLSAHDYRVTAKRREEIIKFTDKLVLPFKDKIATSLQNEGIDVGG